MLKNTPLLFLFLVATLVACNDSGNEGPAPVEVQIAADIPAEVETIITTTGPVANIPGDTASTNSYTFYDLDNGEIVTDSLSSAWDIGFSRTTIIANTGNGGGIQIAEQAYVDANTAPEADYVANTAEASASWYNYNPQTFTISIVEDRTIFVLTPDGNYAKIEMFDYYNTQTSEARYFTFYYTLQTNGTTNFSNLVYYDLDTQATVENPSSPAWDIAFSATTIFANNANGGGVLPLNIAFEDVDEAPIDGYQAQNTSWYSYTGAAPTGPQMAILPKSDLTLVFSTADEKYAKVRILSYYQGNPDTSTPEFANLATRPASRYYTFEFVVQTDGSRFFE